VAVLWLQMASKPLQGTVGCPVRCVAAPLCSHCHRSQARRRGDDIVPRIGAMYDVLASTPVRLYRTKHIAWIRLVAIAALLGRR